MNRIILVILFTLIMTSCAREKSRNLTRFPEKVKIEGKPISKIDFYSAGNVSLKVIDTLLIIQRGEEPMFSIYNTNNYNLLAQFGTMGRGPAEFAMPKLLKQVLYDSISGNPIATVYDFQRRRFSRINLIEALENAIEATSQIVIPNTDSYLTYFYYWDKDFMVATPETEGRFLIHSNTRDENKLIPYLPEVDFDISNSFLPLVYRSEAYVNKDLNRIVAAPSLLGQLDFFNLDGKYLHSTIFDDVDEEKFNKDEKELAKAKMQIIDLDATDELIYCLNYNNSSDDFYGDDYKNLKIQVFDWEGNPIKEYILADARSIRSIAYDVKNNVIFGYSAREMNHNIIIYELDNFKK